MRPVDEHDRRRLLLGDERFGLAQPRGARELRRDPKRRLRIERPGYLSEERFVLNLTAVALEREDGEGLAATRLAVDPPPSAAGGETDTQRKSIL